MQDVADSQATRKGETEAKAHERFSEKKQKRLAKNRVTARRSRYLACMRKCPEHGFEPAADLLASIRAGREKANTCSHYGTG